MRTGICGSGTMVLEARPPHGAPPGTPGATTCDTGHTSTAVTQTRSGHRCLLAGCEHPP